MVFGTLTIQFGSRTRSLGLASEIELIEVKIRSERRAPDPRHDVTLAAHEHPDCAIHARPVCARRRSPRLHPHSRGDKMTHLAFTTEVCRARQLTLYVCGPLFDCRTARRSRPAATIDAVFAVENSSGRHDRGRVRHGWRVCRERRQPATARRAEMYRRWRTTGRYRRRVDARRRASNRTLRGSRCCFSSPAESGIRSACSSSSMRC